MGEYLSPGVYVEEVSSGSKPIAGVGTSTGAFVGVAEKGPLGKAELITNWTQFQKKFGGFVDDAELAHGVYQFFNEGGTKCYVVRTCHSADADLSAATLEDSANADTIRITAANEGTWANKLTAAVEPASNDRDLFKLVLKDENAKGEKIAVEAFDNLDIASIEETVNDQSAFIKVEKDSWDDGGTINGSRKIPWVTKYEQSVVLLGGAEEIADPATDAVAASADLLGANFTTAISVAAVNAGVDGNNLVVTVTDTTSSPNTISIKVSHTATGEEEIFENIDFTTPTINSALITLEAGTAPWHLDVAQTLTLTGTAVDDRITDETGADLFEFTARTGYTATDITVTVEPGDSSGQYDIFVKHKSDPYEEHTGLLTLEIASITSQYVDVELVSGVTLGDQVPRPRKTVDVGPIYQSVNLSGGNDGITNIISTDYVGDAAAGTGLHGFDTVDGINIVAIPDAIGDTYVMKSGLTYCENRKDCFFVADPPKGLGPQDVLKHKLKNLKSSYGSLYYPWIESIHPVTGKKIMLPPSGAVAGIISKTDVARGVHKAPAGTAEGYMKSAVGLEKVLTKGEHDILNNPGINVIREFPGAGICVWGARTLTDDPEWKYVNVRRLFMMIEESIDEGSQWVVFEPNDPSLWGSVKRNITAFLTMLWRDGALYGATPDEAFFVKIDAENNPPEVRDAGQLIIEVGVAPVKPAEFVIIRIQQKTLTK